MKTAIWKILEVLKLPENCAAERKGEEMKRKENGEARQ